MDIEREFMEREFMERERDVKREKRYVAVIHAVVFACYLLLLFRVIIFKFPFSVLSEMVRNWSYDSVKQGVSSANLVPFRTIFSYAKVVKQGYAFANLFGNIFTFLPFGFLLPLVYEKINKFWMIVLHALWLSLGIEIFQLVTQFGVFDIDDMILNTLGAILGYFLFLFLFQVHKKFTERTKKEHKKEIE